MAHGVEQGQVEEAVRIDVRRRQTHAVVDGPLSDGGPFAEPPDEAALDGAREPTVLFDVAGGDDTVEAEALGEGAHEVVRRGGGEHDLEPVSTVSIEYLSSPGLHQVEQRRHRPLGGLAGGLDRPSPHQWGGGPGERHGRDRFAQQVVDPVDEPFTR